MYKFSAAEYKGENQSQKIVILYKKLWEEIYRKSNAAKKQYEPPGKKDPAYYHEIGEIRGGMQIADLLEEMFPQILAKSIENRRKKGA